MSAVKHTPGPWNTIAVKKAGGALGDWDDVGIEAAGVAIAEAWKHCPSRGNPDGVLVNAEANARLIAAAPDLLAALEQSLEALEHGMRVDGYSKTSESAVKSARAAIAKATA